MRPLLSKSVFTQTSSLRRSPIDVSSSATGCLCRTSCYCLLPILAATGGCIALVPRRLALLFAERFELRLLEPPVRFPPLRLRMIWSRAVDTDPGHRWFRQALVTAVAEDDEKRASR
jgi:DNA-binding transcriptional LysR family regulator